MKRISPLFSLLVVCFATTVQARPPTPKPHPELTKLQRFVGDWTYDGEYKPTPLGPGGKVTGEFHVRMVLKGFFAQCDGVERDAMGETRFVEIWGYDPSNKNYFSSRYEDDDGAPYLETFTNNGDTVPVTGSLIADGKRYWTRRTELWSPNGATMKSELSADGKTWILLYEGKVTRANATATK
jgi:uncharacterized protein DUF1579